MSNSTLLFQYFNFVNDSFCLPVIRWYGEQEQEKKTKSKGFIIVCHAHTSCIHQPGKHYARTYDSMSERERGKRVKKDIKWDFLPHFIDTRHSLRSHNRRKRLVSYTQYNSNWTGFHPIHRIPAATQFYFETMALHHMLGFLQSFVVPKQNTLIWKKIRYEWNKFNVSTDKFLFIMVLCPK